MGSIGTEARRTVQTTLNYYLEPSKGGVTTVYPGTASDKRRKHEPRDVEVTDMRGWESAFTLDKQGFQVVQHESEENIFNDDAEIKDKYYAECAELLKRVVNATSVITFSHILRQRTTEDALEAEKNLSDSDKISAAAPIRHVHIDQSDYGAEIRIRDYLPIDTVDRLTRSRWAIINIWRPIGRAVTREPLAVCDARSVRNSELRKVTGILPRKKGDNHYFANTKGNTIEAVNVLPPVLGEEARHEWYYCSKLRPDEVLLIKQFDSKKCDGVARRVPHTAFASSEDEGPARQSIEVRCLVFWEDEAVE